MLPKQSITILGRRWFRRTYGNTYNTATIFVDGKCLHKTAKQYGYGAMFEQLAVDWLEENGYMPDREHHQNGSKEPGWSYFRDKHHLEYSVDVTDVSREKDL